MRLEHMITLETLKALNDLKHITFKPKEVRVRRVPMGTLSKLYPLHVEVDNGKRIPHQYDSPSSSITNCSHVYDMARTFGVRAYRV